MKLNRITGGALIIAGSGMCTGGRILHHFKHNIWRSNCQVVIVGYQAEGTLGHALVNGAKQIRIWGETIRVAAKIHTVGGLSAHADQSDLLRWYRGFETGPRVALVHGEELPMETLRGALKSLGSTVVCPAAGEQIDLISGKTPH